MKKIFLAMAVAAVALTGCKETGTKEISELPETTRGDSLMFYYGQNVGAEYWMSAAADTSMRDQKNRDEFLRGIKAGLSAARDNDAYNKGLYTAVGIAMNIQRMKQDYPDVHFDDKVLYKALIAALANDSAVDPSQVKADFYRVSDNMIKEKEKADKVIAAKKLEEEAAKLGMSKVADGLYGKIIAKGTGTSIKEGDMVQVDISAATVKGELVGMQLPDRLVIGRNYSSPLISQALLTMKSGGTRQFIASPIDLMPRRYRAGEFKPDQVIKFTIKVLGVIPTGQNTEE